MALQLGKDGEMAIVLRVQDDGSVVVEKFGDNTEKSLDKTSKSANKASTDWKKLGKQIAAAAAVAAIALTALIKSSADTADQAAKTADKIGTTTEALTELRYASELTGVAQNTLDMGLQRMTRRVADAAAGNKTYQKALEQLGLNYMALARLSPDQQFQQIAEAMQNVRDEGERVRLTFALFDSEGVALKNTLALGKQGLQRYALEARQFGVVISQEAARQAEYFNDNLTRLKASGSGLSNTLTAELLPSLNAITDAMVDSARQGEGYKTFSSGLATVLKAVAQGAIGVATTFKAAGMAIGAVGAAIALAVQGDFSAAKNVLVNYKTDLENIVQESAALMAKLWVSSGGPPQSNDSPNQPSSSGGNNGGDQEQEDPRTVQLRERLQAELAIMQESWMTEQELIEQNYINEQFLLEEALENKALSIQEHQDLLLKSRADYEKKMAAIQAQGQSREYNLWQSGWKGKLNVMGGVLGMMSNLMQSENKKQFEIGKKAAIAKTVIDTYSAAVGAYQSLASIPFVGPVLGAAAAAAAVLFGKAQVDRIKGQQFGGAAAASPVYAANPNTGLPVSSPESGGAGAAPPPPNQVTQAREAAPRFVDVTIESDHGVVSTEWVRERLIPGINEAYGDGIYVKARAAA